MARFHPQLTLLAVGIAAVAAFCGQGFDSPSASKTVSAAETPAPPVEGTDSQFSNARQRIEDKLKQPLPVVEFHEVPLSEVFDYIAATIEVDIVPSKQFFEDAAIDLDTPITLHLMYGRISAHTLFSLVFELAGCPEAGITIRDEVIYISNQHSGLETVVYDCSDLLPLPPGNTLSATAVNADPTLVAQTFTQQAPRYQTPSSDWAIWEGGKLVVVIRSTVSPQSWNSAGGPGSIEYFDQMLIVNNLPTVHRELAELLELMRKAKQTASPNPSVPTGTN